MINYSLIWTLALDSARHKLLAIWQQEGIEEVKRKGIIIDRKVPRETYLKFCEGEPRISVKHRELLPMMGNWSNRMRAIGEIDVIVDTGSVCHPDVCVQPKNRQQPQPSRTVNLTEKPFITTFVILFG
ncbi:hypothetical protein Glove_606g62 [Diversispora epigaea]|uniref:Uncharacterized protein n=1 Tax=Diversispora epigaea TaxID=1348612 RepID=A0A397G9T8_9GLOM|nr:hypothetical protein Glove_606g62 [Diversispora epigaea]